MKISRLRFLAAAHLNAADTLRAGPSCWAKASVFAPKPCQVPFLSLVAHALPRLPQFNYCRSWLADCGLNDPKLLLTTPFSIKSSFSISAFMDIGTANGGVFLNNTQAGIVIVDATRNFLILACA